MDTDDLKDAATALMATVKKLLTGREMEACEWAKSDQMEFEIESATRHHMLEDDGSCYDYWEARDLAFQDFHELDLLRSLQTQFSREIGDWLNKRNAARSRQAVRA